MKMPICALVLAGALSPVAAAEDCYCRCVPRWSAPSPTLHDACHHAYNGTPFATCTCYRAYSSPHVIGYRGMACYGYQRPSCLCPLECLAGRRRWAPAYCPAPAAVPEASNCRSPADIDDSYQVAFSGWEVLGAIPNDSAAAASSLPAGVPASPAGLLDSIRSRLGQD